MSSRERLLLVNGREELVRKARSCGFDVFRVSVAEATARFSELVAAHERQPFRAVVAQSETGLAEAADLAEACGVRGTDARVCRLLADKWAARQSTAALPCHVPARRLSSVADTRELLAISPQGVVLKPRFGTGSRGVHHVRTLDEASGVVTRLLRAGLDYVAEQFQSGQEVSVETVSSGGRHRIVAITAKTTSPSFVETRHQVPWEGPAALRADVVGAVTTLLRHIDYRDGPAHTELMLTANGTKLIESHARRGGDRIATLVELVYGFDIEEWWFQQLSQGPSGLPRLRAARGTAVIGYAVAMQSGTLTSISGELEARRSPHIVDIEIRKSVGDAVQPARRSEDRLAHAIAFHVDAAIAHRSVDQALSCLRFAIV